MKRMSADSRGRAARSRRWRHTLILTAGASIMILVFSVMSLAQESTRIKDRIDLGTESTMGGCTITITSPELDAFCADIDIYFRASVTCVEQGEVRTGQITWSAPGGQPDTGTGISLITRYSSTGDKVVTVTCGSGDGSCTAQKTVKIIQTVYNKSADCSGFDDTQNPPWLVVPFNNAPNSNTAKVVITPASSATEVFFTTSDAKITVAPAQAATSPETITVTCVQLGEHNGVQARVGAADAPVCKTLNICPRDKKTVTVDFHYVSDNAGHSTTRAIGAEDALLTTMNNIWSKQANVVFVKGVANNCQVQKDLGTVVEWRPTEPANEWDDVVDACSQGNGPDVHFVWEYEQDGTPGTDNVDAAQLGGDILFEDNAGTEIGETLAHEMGHFLGLGDQYTVAVELMYGYTDTRGCEVRHQQVHVANP